MSSHFKQMLEEDIDVFLNIEEMGEKIAVDDTEYNGVIEFPGRDFGETDLDFLSAISMIVYICDCEELHKYKKGKAININNSVYLINDTFVEEGIRIFRLEENRGY